MRFQYPAALLLSLLLAACGTAPRTEPPARVITPGGAMPPPSQPPSPPPPPGTEIRPYQPPGVPPSTQPRPVPNRAVAVLQRRAEDQQRVGDLDGAAASLERALRIAPRDPLTWQRLALVREQQGRYGQAEELASKSNSLAAGLEAELVRDNWRLIARCRRAVGDLAGARAAEARAR
jgi:tetratricopeptide (TPR) repeat protein